MLFNMVRLEMVPKIYLFNYFLRKYTQFEVMIPGERGFNKIPPKFAADLSNFQLVSYDLPPSMYGPLLGGHLVSSSLSVVKLASFGMTLTSEPCMIFGFGRHSTKRTKPWLVSGS